MVRVLHVLNQLCGRGGAEVSLRDLIVATQGRGLEHGVAVLSADGNDFAATDGVGAARFVPGSSLNRLSAVRHVAAAIRAFEPDVVHTCLFEADLAGRVAARAAGVPTVTSIVNAAYSPAARRHEPVSRAKLELVRRVDGVLARHATTELHALTEAVADEAVSALGVGRERIHVVPRGRSRSQLGWPSRHRREGVRQRLGVPADQPLVVNIARQEPQKGQRYLLEATAWMRHEARCDVRVLIAGREGRSTSQLRGDAERLGVADAVDWLGARDDAADLLAAADVFAFPSLYEGLGGAVLEAMALRVPVVAADVPAVREVLDGGRAGHLVPPADGPALADGILHGLSGRPEVAEKVDAAEQRFLAHYELDAVAVRMQRLYEHVVAG